MFNIQYIKIPFVSAFSIDNYAEALALGISISGDYIEAGYAIDEFTGYLVGFNRFFSGSGYWLASGSSLPLSQYLLDSYSGYSLGFYQNSSLNKTELFNQFDPQFGLFTGNIYRLSNYLLDNYSGYATGVYQYDSLNSALLFEGYDAGSGLFTGNIYLMQKYFTDSFSGYSSGAYIENSLNKNFSQYSYDKFSNRTTGNLNILQNYGFDNFSGYSSGTYINNSLDENLTLRRYNVISGQSTGNLNILSQYFTDNLSLYSTGDYSSLSGNLEKIGYNDLLQQTTGNLTKLSFNFSGGNFGGGTTGYYWRITYVPYISSDCGYINDGYYCTTGVFADYLPYNGMTITGDPNGPFGLNDFTVEFWMKRNGWNPNLLATIVETDPIYGFSITRQNSTDRLQAYANNSWVFSSGTVPNNSWVHIAFTRQGSGLNLYFSGILNANNAVFPNTGKLAQNEVLAVGTTSFFGGQSDSLYPYVGCIDELRIWNYARSQSQIQANMNSQITTGEGLITYLTFDN